MTEFVRVRHWRFGRLLKLGVGHRPWRELEAAAAELTPRERRATARALRNGAPASDARTARYAVALTPLYASMADPYRRSRTRTLYAIFAVLQLANVALHAADGAWVNAALFAVCAAIFASIAIRPPTHGRPREALAENLRLAGMPGDEAPALTPARVSRAELLSGVAVAFFVFAILSSAGVVIGAAGSAPVGTILAVGAGTSAVLLAFIWLFGRALRRTQMTPRAVRAVTHPAG